MKDKQLLIDKNDGLNRVRGNEKLYRRMLGMFLADTQHDMLEAAFKNKDLKQAEAAAHALKGLTGNLGLSALYQKCTELLDEIRNGVLDENRASEFRSLHEETASCVKAYLEELI